MVLYGIGGMFSSCLIGFICDRLPTRKLGYGLIVYNGLSLAFLYFALYIKYFYTTLLLFMFLGMTQFAVLVWLMAAISKLYKGIFEVIAANAQSVAMAASGYGFGTIFFEGRMQPQTKLGIELALLLGMNAFAFIFARNLPDDPVTIDYLVEEPEETSEEPPSRVREDAVERREAPVEVEIEMVQKHRELE
jgi:predicted MFS family arabinose efflux permease